MAAKDKYHEHVKEALIKDGWTITDDPYVLSIRGTDYEIDLGAEKMIAATKENDRILVEVKSLLRDSIVYEFHSVLGQFMAYRLNIKDLNLDRILYVAISYDAYKKILRLPAVLHYIEEFQIKLIIFEIDTKQIKEWIK